MKTTDCRLFLVKLDWDFNESVSVKAVKSTSDKTESDLKFSILWKQCSYAYMAQRLALSEEEERNLLYKKANILILGFNLYNLSLSHFSCVVLPGFSSTILCWGKDYNTLGQLAYFLSVLEVKTWTLQLCEGDQTWLHLRSSQTYYSLMLLETETRRNCFTDTVGVLEPEVELELNQPTGKLVLFHL